MRAWAGLLVAAGLATQSGCKVFERWSKDRPLGTPASRTRDDDVRDPSRPPKSWLDNTPLPGGRPAAVPSAATLGDPRDPNFDLRTEVKGMLAGIVVDPDGRGVPYLSIQIDLSDPMQNGGAPVTAETDRNGYFLIRGLKPSQAYTLSAQAKQGGRVIAGQTVVKPPSPTVRIQLREDVALPAADRGTDLPPAGGSSPAPPSNGIPGGVPSLFDSPATGPPAAPTPVPLTRDNSALPYPSENSAGGGAYSPVPPAASKPSTAPVPKPATVPRPELVAPGPYPEKPPPASIPGPGTTPDGLIPPPALPPRTSRFTPRPSPGPFALTDPLGRPRQFPSGRAGELVLLDFMTTTCAPCRKAVPALTALQAKYGAAGLEVVGVTCDDVSEAARRSLAARYADEHRLNYLVYAESGSVAGRVMKHFAVTGFPTLVLIDGTGSILWQGHPTEIDELERVVGDASAKRR